MFFTTKKSLLKQNILFAMKSTEIFSKKLLNIFDTLLYTRYNSFVLSMKQYTKYSTVYCMYYMHVSDRLDVKINFEKREQQEKNITFLTHPWKVASDLTKDMNQNLFEIFRSLFKYALILKIVLTFLIGQIPLCTYCKLYSNTRCARYILQQYPVCRFPRSVLCSVQSCSLSSFLKVLC